jgi:hypothetical protein
MDAKRARRRLRDVVEAFVVASDSPGRPLAGGGIIRTETTSACDTSQRRIAHQNALCAPGRISDRRRRETKSSR